MHSARAPCFFPGIKRITSSQLEKPTTEAYESHENASFIAQSCDSPFLSSILQCLVQDDFSHRLHSGLGLILFDVLEAE